MNCPYCKNQAEWVDNATVYGRRYGKSYMMWICRPCDARVGCHNNTKRPLGTMANKALREKRIVTHAVVDELWKSKRFRRSYVYNFLNDAFGKSVHIGESSAEVCDEIIKTIAILN